MLQDKEALKSGLQEVLAAEPIASVRRAACVAVATIARTAVPAGEWPTLLPWVHQCTQSPNNAHRETAILLLCSLTDTIGEFQPYISRCSHIDRTKPCFYPYRATLLCPEASP